MIKDCVSRAEVIKSIGNNININFEGQRGLAKYEEDVKLILQCLLDEQIKRVEALPSVVPTFTKGVTNGYVVKTMFPDADVKEMLGSRSQDYLWNWWDAPYKGVEE